MKISKKFSLVDNQASSSTHKKPKQLIKNLNQGIASIQKAVKEYNKTQDLFNAWKTQLNLNGNSCQLKPLTEPKYQNILLENNFINSSVLFNQNDNLLKSSILKKRNLSKKNSMYNTNYSLKRTNSFMKDSRIKGNNENDKLNQKYQQLRNKNVKFAQNQTIQIRSYKNVTTPHFMSFRNENVSKTQNKSSKKNYSQRKQFARGPQVSSSFLNSQLAESKILKGDRDNATVIQEESKSIYMTLSNTMNPEELPNNLGKNISKTILFGIPQSKERQLQTISSMRNSRNIRKRIEQKEIELQKQWEKTHCYRQKFNITVQQKQFQPLSRTKRMSNKLDRIIQKVQNRRPQTSLRGQSRQNQGRNTQFRQTHSKTQKLISKNDFYKQNSNMQDNSSKMIRLDSAPQQQVLSYEHYFTDF